MHHLLFSLKVVFWFNLMSDYFFCRALQNILLALSIACAMSQKDFSYFLRFKKACFSLSLRRLCLRSSPVPYQCDNIKFEWFLYQRIKTVYVPLEQIILLCRCSEVSNTQEIWLKWLQHYSKNSAVVSMLLDMTD